MLTHYLLTDNCGRFCFLILIGFGKTIIIFNMLTNVWLTGN